MTIRPLVEVAILGFLNEWNQLSIDTLSDRLRHNFGPFWTFGYGTLLPAVSELEDRGHVRLVTGGEDTFPETEETEAGTDESEYTYEITAEGRERLQELLRQPLADVEDPKQRYRVIIKLGFIHHLPPEDQAAEFGRLIDRFTTFRTEYEEVRDDHDRETMADFDRHGYRVELIDLSIEMIDTLVDWLERHREIAREKAQREPTGTDK